LSQILFERRDGVAVITIAAPDRLNAFTRAMRAEIIDRLNESRVDRSTIGAVITGAGEAFCAGQDLNEVPTWTAETPWVAEFESLFRALFGFHKPLVAGVNGVAAGGGFQVALTCDTRIGHAGTRMGQPEVRTGLASVTGTWLMQGSVGLMRARELALSGRLMAAEELMRLGFLDALVPRERLLDSAIDRVRELASSPADSYARTKAYLYDSLSDEIASVCAAAERQHRRGFVSGVSQDGARQFLAPGR